MTRSIEVELDANGVAHPVVPGQELPTGKMLLVWQAPEEMSAWKLSQKSFAKDWERPEEDEAWAYLQSKQSLVKSAA